MNLANKILQTNVSPCILLNVMLGAVGIFCLGGGLQSWTTFASSALGHTTLCMNWFYLTFNP